LKICNECNKEFIHYRWKNICPECRNKKISEKTKIAMTIPETYNKLGSGSRNRFPWNKNLTKETDERIAKYSKNISISKKEKFISGELKVRKGKDCNFYGKSPKNINGWGKRSKYVDKLGRNFIFKSTWELAFAKRLDELNLCWDYEPKHFPLSNGKSYIPDFFVENKNWIEIKGIMIDDAQEKIIIY